MTQTLPECTRSCDQEADLETVLAAWHDATLRLEQTHEALRGEVRRLTEELEIKNRELARKNRLADLGQMASHIAHEVRNNLVPVALYLSLLRRRISGDHGSLDVLDKVDSGLTSLDATVNDLLNFAAERDPQLTRFNLKALIEDVYASLRPQFSAQDIRTRIDIAENLSVTADRDMLRRAALNITLNSLDAMLDGGELTATAYRSAAGVELELADNGPGLSDEARQRAFEPFYSTKNTGTGLGLAIVYRTAEAHGGEATAANCPEGGAAFTIRLPHRALEAAA
ncbi:MAG TPA: ATP-binding protein [Pirellulales bacterium]|nr:ATP-binding protein [Pirellulales bacterium]